MKKLLIEPKVVRKLFLSARNNLANRVEEINKLNVFPVPDGDTGTNMLATIDSGISYMQAEKKETLQAITTSFAKGCLLGARGNSGVITSQIFKGFSLGFTEDTAPTVKNFVKAFKLASKTAYKAVMSPVEGTILTVVREATEKTEEKISELKTVTGIFETIVNEGKISLNKTPELLPILKEAGVVDSGGFGFVTLMEGMFSAILGNPIQPKKGNEIEVNNSDIAKVDPFKNVGYCTEGILKLKDPSGFDISKVEQFLGKIGDSIVAIQDLDIFKFHVHTLNPGKVFSEIHKHGEYIDIKSENMSLQVGNHDGSPEIIKKKNLIISVSPSEGINKFLEGYGVDVIISGGQTMNPSSKDFIDTIIKNPAENYIIIPNNSNIILSAQQAAKNFGDKKNIVVLETKNLAQGIGALVAFNKEETLKNNELAMIKAISTTQSGEITEATRDVLINGVDVKKGSYIGIHDGKITHSLLSMRNVGLELVKEMNARKEVEIFTIIKGKNCTVNQAKHITDWIDAETDAEFEVVDGRQDIYSIIIVAE